MNIPYFARVTLLAITLCATIVTTSIFSKNQESEQISVVERTSKTKQLLTRLQAQSSAALLRAKNMGQAAYERTLRLYSKSIAFLAKRMGKSYIDRYALADTIKGHLYMMYHYQMGVIIRDWMAFAQGNKELAQDLKELYTNYFMTCHHLQKCQGQLDAFCKKWKLVPIKIRAFDKQSMAFDAKKDRFWSYFFNLKY